MSYRNTARSPARETLAPVTTARKEPPQLVLQILTRPQAQAPATFDLCSTADSIFSTVCTHSMPEVVV